ncbi:uncharacterized protein SPSK_03416 [Sporothrix schenckii 1099-18]|uniref:Protein kinase domain-containing protein n=2 Tax=Sporothrix schenckii TaxID=29908 RepID=U7PRV7_SPOS1|nr:uncharacterized protein SPSK_03416 [Sporothrix schenckii 1099-18]ERS97454.1 hypothetical protein HMPREF1624_05621 [Sporothrix schenckii ATCC 58251]KJR81955.1 hypothetical protein SPSK_03416 [Sporothrix schenckii 1099-18]
MYEYQSKQDPPRPVDFPYQVGRSFSIRRHRAPPPFGQRYRISPGLRKHTHFGRDPALSKLSNLERCLRHPPQERPPDEDEDGEEDDGKDGNEPDYDKVYTLQITEEIVARVGHGAQILRCRVDGEGDNKDNYVAKIYDGAYFNEDDGWFGDVSFDADHEYSVEVAAYEHLNGEGADGRYTPCYYGSYTFELPVPKDESGHADRPPTRPVRLIIIEYIAGTSMFALLKRGVVDTIPVPRRLELMADAMESRCQLDFLGLAHNDFEPRNVLVLDAALREDDEAGQCVVIVDLGRSYIVDSYWLSPKYVRPRQPKPISPMYVFWGSPLNSFAAWIPHVYHRRWPAFNGWLKHRWGSTADDEDKYYVPRGAVHRETRRYDDETEYIPPESIPLVEDPIPGKIVRSLDPDYEKKVRESWN